MLVDKGLENPYVQGYSDSRKCEASKYKDPVFPGLFGISDSVVTFGVVYLRDITENSERWHSRSFFPFLLSYRRCSAV